MCAEQIPLEATVCEYCAAQFEVTITGYCQNCHQVREADENGCCKVCNGEIIDRRVESRLVEEPVKEITPPYQPEVTKTERSGPSIGILVGMLIVAVIGVLLWFQRNSLPLVSSLFITPTLTDTSTPLPTITPIPTATSSPQPSLQVKSYNRNQQGGEYHSLAWYAENWYFGSSPGVRTWHVEISKNQPIVISLGWCTSVEKILDQNMEHISYSLEINGDIIPLDSLFMKRSVNDDQTACDGYSGIIWEWPIGNHQIRITYHFDEVIDDGYDSFPPGDYVQIYNVTVSR